MLASSRCRSGNGGRAAASRCSAGCNPTRRLTGSGGCSRRPAVVRGCPRAVGAHRVAIPAAGLGIKPNSSRLLCRRTLCCLNNSNSGDLNGKIPTKTKKVASISKKPTIRDVARLAGVGVGSVSRVLNKSTSVKPKIRQTVERVIADIGFEPDRIAGSMRRLETYTVGCVIRDFNLPGFSEFLLAAESAI